MKRILFLLMTFTTYVGYSQSIEEIPPFNNTSAGEFRQSINSNFDVTSDSLKTLSDSINLNSAFRLDPSSIIIDGANLSWNGDTLNATSSVSVAWGTITGTLSSQTDLQNALNAKQNTITDSDDISEGSTNLFLTTTERSNISTNNTKVSYTDASDVSSNTTFRTTPSTEITAGTNISWSGNTLNATGTGGDVSMSDTILLIGTKADIADLQEQLNDTAVFYLQAVFGLGSGQAIDTASFAADAYC